jgi:hypothetical protein
MKSFFLIQWLSGLPIRRKLYLIIGLLFANLLIVISLGVFGFTFLSNVRSFVGAEGLWAKAQKNAIFSLSNYTLSHSERDFISYKDALEVPRSYNKARLAMMKSPIDFAGATPLNIDDTVMAKLRRESARQGRTMSGLVESALRLLFKAEQAPRKKLPPLLNSEGYDLVNFGSSRAGGVTQVTVGGVSAPRSAKTSISVFHMKNLWPKPRVFWTTASRSS